MELTLQDVMHFRCGLLRWCDSGDLTLSDLLPDKRATLLLEFLYTTPAFDLLDGDFNGLSFDEVCEMLEIEISTASEATLSDEYELIPIGSFDQAMHYRDLAPDWCIFNGREIWEKYKNGNWKFIFIVNKNASSVKRTVRPGFPYDTYGSSFMCFSSYDNGGVKELFTRWNGFDGPVWVWGKILKKLLKERYTDLRELVKQQSQNK